MAHIIPTSVENFSSSPVVPLLTKNSFLVRSSFTCKLRRKSLPVERCRLPLSISPNLFPRCIVKPIKAFASGADVAVEEPVSQVDVGDAGSSATAGESSTKDANASRVKRPKSGRKSEMPAVKNEDLVPGATFAGKVRSIQPFGAFVDFGAFTDGLVHVSQLSDSFVKDVASVVTVGQEVKVRLVEANMDTGRISLSMREGDDSSSKQKGAAPVNGEKPRFPRKTGPRKDEAKKLSKFVKGQELVGTVKNLTRAGAFISLPEGEEGFLPTSEEADEGYSSMMGASSLDVDQEVNVRVLRITRGQVTLTMKKQDDAAEVVAKLNQGVVHKATNPFALAFRNDKDISSFLDGRKKDDEAEAVEKPEELESQADSISLASSEELLSDDVSSSNAEESSDVSASSEGLVIEELAPSEGKEVLEVEGAVDEVVSADLSEGKEELEVEAAVDEVVSTDVSEGKEELELEAAVDEVVSADLAEGKEELEVEAAVDEEVSSDLSEGKEELKVEAAVDEVVSSEVISESPQEAVELKVEDQTESSDVEETAESDPEESRSTEISEIQDSGEITSNGSVDEGGASDSTDSSTPKAAAISAALVKQLREESGAGMMDCKKALSETGGDIVKAQEYLRKKGLASADKKASRATAEGIIASYIHDSRIGVLIEVNCETDFVARGDIFKELVEDLAMQVAACPQVEYLTIEDIPSEIVDKEKEMVMQKEDLLSKPEQMRSKIVEGRVKKRLGELALLEQPFIKDDKVMVKDWVKQTISTVGENMKVKRFVRFNLGEGLEKRNLDFAAEVAAQTAAKSAPVNQAPAESSEKAEKVTVSAALVKQLREETGAGMMDCKKALSETGGDLEKAQEYLRKKGLSAADKKSSRIAAEGSIGAYIHDSRIGVIVEVNCETDFVGRSQPFKELVDDLAMQAVACPQVRYVSVEDIPEEVAAKEKELEMQREDLQAKPENMREKIVAGRLSKRLGELALLEQAFIKNDDGLLVKDLVKQSVAALGENIKVRRFARFTLGETAAKAEA